MKTLQSKIIPSNVGIIYYKCFVIQQESLTARLLSSYSVHYQILCAKGTKKTLQFTIIPQVFYTCSVIQQESFTAVLLSAYSVHDQTLCAKGKMKTLQSTIISSNVDIIYPLSRYIIHQDIFSRIVGMIYPIPTKASNCVKCPKLFDFISIRISKCLFYIPAPEGRTETVQLTFIPQELA